MSRPWMPLYIADYLADTGHLDCAEHGAYLLLIMHYWQRKGLPNDDKKLASIARAKLEQWQAMKDTLADLFGPNWTHARVDTELQKAEDKYEKRAKAGSYGGKAKAAKAKMRSSNATAMLQQNPSNALPTTTTYKDKDTDVSLSFSSEPEKWAPSAVAELPTVSEGDIPFFETDVAEWSGAYPAVDVRQQLAAMRSWLIANPAKRKTKRGMRRFVVAWLDRKQNSGGTLAVARAPPAPKKPTLATMWRDEAREKGYLDDPANDEDPRCLETGNRGGANTITLVASRVAGSGS